MEDLTARELLILARERVELARICVAVPSSVDREVEKAIEYLKAAQIQARAERRSSYVPAANLTQSGS
jgi:hypothetical protein